jgi:hypothetical protein
MANEKNLVSLEVHDKALQRLLINDSFKEINENGAMKVVSRNHNNGKKKYLCLLQIHKPQSRKL